MERLRPKRNLPAGRSDESLQAVDSDLGEIHYLDLKPDQPVGQPILLLGGFGSSFENLRGSCLSLYRMDRRVVSVDYSRLVTPKFQLPKMSDMFLEAAYDYVQHQKFSVETVLRVLRDRTDFEGELNVIAVSSGSLSAVRLAGNHENGIAKLCLVMPAGLIGKDELWSRDGLAKRFIVDNCAENLHAFVEGYGLRNILKQTWKYYQEAKLVAQAELTEDLAGLINHSLPVAILYAKSDAVFEQARLEDSLNELGLQSLAGYAMINQQQAGHCYSYFRPHYVMNSCLQILGSLPGKAGMAE